MHVNEKGLHHGYIIRKGYLERCKVKGAFHILLNDLNDSTLFVRILPNCKSRLVKQVEESPYCTWLNVLGQDWGLQLAIVLLSPVQGLPPRWGEGRLQLLTSVWTPPPHVLEQDPSFLQSPQLPWIFGGESTVLNTDDLHTSMPQKLWRPMHKQLPRICNLHCIHILY